VAAKEQECDLGCRGNDPCANKTPERCCRNIENNFVTE
jgi:hypothetical protein